MLTQICAILAMLEKKLYDDPLLPRSSCWLLQEHSVLISFLLLLLVLVLVVVLLLLLALVWL